MKTRILIMALFTVLSLNTLNAQKISKKSQKSSSIDSVKIITIDCRTNSFEKNVILKNVKVNSWVQFKIVNINEDLKAEGTVNYTNRNLEHKNTFGSYLNFEKNNKNSPSNIDTITATESDKIKELADKTNFENALAKKIQASDSIKKEFVDLKSKVENRISVKTNLNEQTMVKDFEINDAVKYLNNQKGEGAEKAIIDINWQKKLIKILQNNLIKKIAVRDSLITDLSQKIDTINAKLKTKIVVNTKFFPPIKIQNYDYSEFFFELKNKNNNVVEKFNVPFSNTKGFKLDFSTGFVFNGLNSKSYKILPSNTNNVIIKEEEKSTSFNTGIALLAHAYSRSGKFINLGLTSGLSFNLNNQNLNYMFGLSSLLGEDQRFIISFGITAGKVKELVKYYNTTEAIPITELPLTAQVPTVEKLKATWFLSLTYNLGISDSTKSIKL